MLSKSQFIQRARMMDEACRQWCDLIEECKERIHGQGFTEFYHEICARSTRNIPKIPVYMALMCRNEIPL